MVTPAFLSVDCDISVITLYIIFLESILHKEYNIIKFYA